MRFPDGTRSGGSPQPQDRADSSGRSHENPPIGSSGLMIPGRWWQGRTMLSSRTRPAGLELTCIGEKTMAASSVRLAFVLLMAIAVLGRRPTGHAAIRIRGRGSSAARSPPPSSIGPTGRAGAQRPVRIHRRPSPGRYRIVANPGPAAARYLPVWFPDPTFDESTPIVIGAGGLRENLTIAVARAPRVGTLRRQATARSRRSARLRARKGGGEGPRERHPGFGAEPRPFY